MKTMIVLFALILHFKKINSLTKLVLIMRVDSTKHADEKKKKKKVKSPNFFVKEQNFPLIER